MARPLTLFVKPPDPFLEEEFVYQQLAPHYLQAWLDHHGYPSRLAVFHCPRDADGRRREPRSLDDCHVILIEDGHAISDGPFDPALFEDVDLLALSVMTPQAEYAGWIAAAARAARSTVRVMIGGSHARYYLDQVVAQGGEERADYVVPHDGWQPLLDVLDAGLPEPGPPRILSHQQDLAAITVPPTRPLELMRRYRYEIAGLPAFHTVTALGCPFTCHFCEAGGERTRFFPRAMVDADLAAMAAAHRALGREHYAVMFFDDVGLLNPRQTRALAERVAAHGYSAWRAFTHAYLVVRHAARLLQPFADTGGRRIGIGIETGSQRSLDLINKRNGKAQLVEEHYEAVRIANRLGIAVDAFTMIYPWEDETDLALTTELVEFVVANPVAGEDHLGRPLRNSIDSTIMLPYQGTRFGAMLEAGAIPGVRLKSAARRRDLFYKGVDASSGWVYERTVLPRERYLEVQRYRNSLRPSYR
ncbi:MAG: radical SAM protein [Gammaproteobacteria bacterium]|nr:radical SAM protein [Gammaproteobacteria bacterium]MCP5200794.1 radical SAM protein [Gammaproteobacteria bacterium]